MENLRLLREEHKITQREFAKELGISKTTLCYYEQGKVSPSVEMLIKLADFFNCSIDYLLGHQPQNVLYLDSLTDEQKEAVELVKQLENRQVLKVIGYIERIKDTPFEDVVNRILKKEE